MDKKYELVMDDSIVIGDSTLYRIKALRDFNNVKVGDLGGYIEKESNLSHEGNCWVYNDARVSDDAMVYGNAMVFSNAQISGDAWVYGNARISDDAWVYGNAQIYDNARISGNARIFDNTWVCDNAKISDNARVYNNACIYNNTRVYDNAKVYGDTEVCNNVIISNNADISSNNDYLHIKGLGSENRDTSIFKLTNGDIFVECGCFEGTLDNFESKVKETHGDNKYGKEYNALIYICKLHFDLV